MSLFLVLFFLGSLLLLLSHLLHTTTNSTFKTRLNLLSSAPTLPLASLPAPNFKQPFLVHLQNAFVRPLKHPFFTSSLRYAVLLKNIATNSVYSVPFALSESALVPAFRVSVVNAGARHLPLELDRSFRTVVTTRMRIFKRIVRRQELFLGGGTKIVSVFGILRSAVDDSGEAFLEIEPSKMFPAECFTMNRWEIEEKVKADARAGRNLSLAVGIVAAGVLIAGVYCGWKSQ